MTSTSRIVGSLSTFMLLILMVLPVQAAPALSKGSSAHYALTADLQASQTCDASSVTYNQTACGPYIPSYGVNIWESTPGTCSSSTNCFFSPSDINLGTGYRVVWTNNGQSPHTVTSCSTVNTPPTGACPVMNDSSLPSFNSGMLSAGQTFEYSFDHQGTYNYFCSIHPFLHGTVVVSGPGPSPQPPPPAPMFDLDGGVGWEVLDISDVALLKVSHEISFTLGPSGPSFSEEGSFEESVDLATRRHESGTLVELLETLLRAYAAALSSSYYYPSPVLQGLQSYGSEPIYTFWWVNGPLTESSPVLILMGYSGVRGSETLDLGGNIGQRAAWIVASEVSQSFTTETPYPSATTTASVDISLRFDFDQKSDLLLKSVFQVQILASMVTTYEQGQTLCGIGGCRTVSERVVVTQQMSATASLILQLDDTNLRLDRRTHGTSGTTQSGSTAPPGDTSSPPEGSGLLASSLLPIGIAGAVAAGLVSLGVWVAVRSRRKPLHPLDISPPTP